MYIDNEILIIPVVIAIATGLAIGMYLTCQHIAFGFNKSTCSVYVNKEPVYSGFCHFVNVSPVGEYGNTKRVAIYSDVAKLRQAQKYISDDVEIKAK